jgi:hypothetical protein
VPSLIVAFTVHAEALAGDPAVAAMLTTRLQIDLAAVRELPIAIAAIGGATPDVAAHRSTGRFRSVWHRARLVAASAVHHVRGQVGLAAVVSPIVTIIPSAHARGHRAGMGPWGATGDCVRQGAGRTGLRAAAVAGIVDRHARPVAGFVLRTASLAEVIRCRDESASERA